MVSMKYKLPCILYAISLVYASSLKGIDPKKSELYKPQSDGKWTCLDGSKTISFSAVNDDYCDCLDGSDEPGTSACSNSMFYCANVGHIPTYIRSSAVNDGVCDEACCDGSDENGDLISCPNRCQEVGEAYRLKQTSLKQSTEAGLQAKRQLIHEASKQITLWQEDESKIADEIFLKKASLLRLQRELQSLEVDKETEKCEVDASEISTLKNGIAVLKKGIDQLKDILGDMKRDHNQNYHDMAVKSAITAYDEFVERYSKIESEIISQLENTNENNIPEKIIERDDDSSEEETTDALEKVQQSITDVETEINKLENDLQAIKKDLETDFGLEKEWLKLKDVCIEKNEGEYTYSICILGDTYQKSNKDSTRTHLGKFSSFAGNDGDLYNVHSHTHGTRCWNGPERSVKATFECGLDNEILSVTEPEKCEYHFLVKSPAVCKSLADAEPQEKETHKTPVHEEL